MGEVITGKISLLDQAQCPGICVANRKSIWDSCTSRAHFISWPVTRRLQVPSRVSSSHAVHGQRLQLVTQAHLHRNYPLNAQVCNMMPNFLGKNKLFLFLTRHLLGGAPRIECSTSAISLQLSYSLLLSLALLLWAGIFFVLA